MVNNKKSTKNKSSDIPNYESNQSSSYKVLIVWVIIVIIGYIAFQRIFPEFFGDVISFEFIFGFISVIAVIIGFSETIKIFLKNFENIDKETKDEISTAKEAYKEEPDKVTYLWDISKATLQGYFNKNLSQISSIYVLATIVMILGFVIICIGLLFYFNNSNDYSITIITSIVGVLTEFISATFVLMYKTTLDQASKYLDTLQKIHTVGMAMQIIDSIPDNASQDDIKNSTKANFVNKLAEL